MKNITRERKILENRRLDLDACKGKVRKARAMQLQPVVSVTSLFYLNFYTYYSTVRLRFYSKLEMGLLSLG